MNVLVTGASGFIGSKFLALLNNTQGITAVGTSRRFENISRSAPPLTMIGDINGHTDWSFVLSNINVVVHMAARAHVISDITRDAIEQYRLINVEGTLNLARQAALAGVSRFVFISSIKVNGESTPAGQIFTADDEPAPLCAYGISKWEAERGLREISRQTSMEVVIIRPPLVYGEGVKANFALVLKWLRSGLPLPFGAIQNKRSFVGVDNLLDLTFCCLTHPAAANQIFLVSDGEDVSTTTLLCLVSQAMGRPPRLFNVSCDMLRFLAKIFGKSESAERLCGSLQVDIRKTRNVLGWSPPFSLEQGLKRMIEY
jgi:nucleoside-diphosphate-sugar epimerase